MKFLPFFAILFFFSSCKKDAKTTANGAFSAIIDGSLWQASIIKVTDNGGYFTINASDANNKGFRLVSQSNTAGTYNFRPQEVVLGSFNCALRIGTDNKLHLSWQTISERNLQRFEIERSSDGSGFSIIGNVAANGNSTTPLDYHFEEQPGVLNTGNLTRFYYRIKMINTDGTFQYSSIRTISIMQNLFFLGGAEMYAYGFDGTFTLSSVNQAARKISGTFNFKYIDTRTGAVKQVNAGVFNNMGY